MDSKKVALITGGGRRRIGWNVAETLAKRGYSIALHYRTSGSEAEENVQQIVKQGGDAAAFGADLTDEKQVGTMVEQVQKRFGRIDVLVHTAALWHPKKLEEVTAADMRGFLEINTLGTFLCCQQAGLAMAKQPEGGSIVVFGDWACIRPYADYAAYFPSKGAIPTLTWTMAVELAARNPRVRVNCILPGPVMLPADLPAHEREQAIRGTLVKREGSPQNIVLAVLHFIENDFVTGTCLPVDGGRSVYAPDSDH
ncbi:MAG TPA: SDR family oxidoreductase [Pirellulales bacterium]|jgi:pteridine reductase